MVKDIWGKIRQAIFDRRTLLSDARESLLLLWHHFGRRRPVVVIERAQGIGDIVCLLASFPGLRAKYPRGYLVMITAPNNRALAAMSELADGVVTDQGILCRILRRYGRTRYFKPLTPEEHNPPEPRTLRRLVDLFADELGVAAPSGSVRLRAPERLRGRIATRLAEVNRRNLPVVVIHTGPSWAVKEWPNEYWGELGRRLAVTAEVCLVQIGADVDGFRTKRIAARIPGAVDWVNHVGLVETVALLEESSAFVGIDSGMMHLAAATETPIVGLTGPTNGPAYIQRSANARFLEGKVPCIGCQHEAKVGHWRTGCPNDIACMKAISVDAVCAGLSEVPMLRQ